MQRQKGEFTAVGSLVQESSRRKWMTGEGRRLSAGEGQELDGWMG